jgi:large conductance mechanosensitive channel
MWREFKAFLIKQNALALAIAVVIGGALDKVVKALVDGFVMPFVAVASPDPSSYEKMTLGVGALQLKPGLIISAVINFVIVGFVAWRLSKIFIREAPAADTKALKACPFCFMGDLDIKATRCPHCTSPLDAAALPPGGAPSLVG